jgi:hypothetical protein
VVIGPASLSRTSDAPKVLEYGGTTIRTVFGRKVMAHYPERPYMRPALKKIKPKLAEMWRDAVKQ